MSDLPNGTRVRVHDMHDDVPDDHDGAGTIRDGAKGDTLFWVQFDGCPDWQSAWFRANEFEVLHDGTTQHKGKAEP